MSYVVHISREARGLLAPERETSADSDFIGSALAHLVCFVGLVVKQIGGNIPARESSESEM
ncbi:hypothetical protein AB4Y44_40120 [Paraburkholderia sp. BR10937]|uniref:hypothetical protein n=1 Tax=Paraburkholderia sp. BR10937 TaxID=3236994 RepID=UPI0034D25642